MDSYGNWSYIFKFCFLFFFRCHFSVFGAVFFYKKDLWFRISSLTLIYLETNSEEGSHQTKENDRLPSDSQVEVFGHFNDYTTRSL